MVDRPSRNPRPGRGLDRRTVLRATAGAAAALAVGDPSRAGAYQVAETLGAEWVEEQELGISAAQTIGEAPAAPITFQTAFPFSAVAPHWSGESAPGAVVELSFSADGVSWTEPFVVGESLDHLGPPDRDGRRFGPLVATPYASFVRYLAYDAGGVSTTLPGLTFAYFDASPGPTVYEIAQPAVTPSLAPPPIISRATWGANERYRFNRAGKEIWPPEYQTVEHVVVHHTDTANFQEPLLAIRSVYYYHAVTRGWGDVGYNYLIDFLGNVYEGRIGGENVVGGHARPYNRGTCGIGLLGRFHGETVTPEMRAALVWLTAWAGRALDPLAAPALSDIPSLPTICGHRDVNPTTCPGETFYAEFPALRDAVGVVLGAGVAPEPAAPQFAPGQEVTTTVADASLRDGPGLDYGVIVTLALAAPLTISSGPTTNDGHVWYEASNETARGWIAADLLAPVEGAKPVTAEQATLAVGTTVRVVDGELNLRGDPGVAAPVVQVLADGAQLTVIGGPTKADGYVWFEVDSGVATGWAVADFLQAV